MMKRHYAILVNFFGYLGYFRSKTFQKHATCARLKISAFVVNDQMTNTLILSKGISTIIKYIYGKYFQK